MPSKPFSYEEYLEITEGSSVIKIHENSSRVIDRYRKPEYNMPCHEIVIFLVEYTTKKYIYVSEACLNVLGYSAKEFMQINLGDFLNTWHPGDFEIMNTKVFPDNYKFFKKIPLEKYGDFIFSYNYRVRNFRGDYITLLQRFSYIPSNKMGMPYGVIGLAFDISHFKSDISVVHTIEETIRQDGELVNNLIFKKVHPVYEHNISDFLSRKELEVLEYMSKGLSSKLIADKMKISINTVHNHRRSMLLKTNCKSSSGLVNYAVKHGLL